jgi:hypothetical protein
MLCPSVVNMLLIIYKKINLMKDVCVSMQKTITWTRKGKNGRHEWARVYKDAYLHPQKLKTPMKS